MATHRPDLGNASGGSEMRNTNKNEKSPKIANMVIVILLLTIPLSGCVGDTENDRELVIVTYDVYALTDEVIEEFENEKGISFTNLKLNDAGSILDYLIQHQGREDVDLAIGMDNNFLGTAIEFDLLAESDVNQVGIRNDALGPYSGPLATPFDMGYVCLNYDTEQVDGENLTVPTSLWNLTEEEWRGKVALPSPVTSSPGRAFMLATLDYFDWEDGNDEFSSWWTAMKDNDVIITSGWSEAYEPHYTGGYGEGTKSASLDLPKTSFLQVEYAAAVNGGNIETASEFINYLISPEVNSLMPTENLMYSVLEGQDLPEENGYLLNSVIPQQPSQISMNDISENIELWLEEWNSAMTSGE